MITPATASTGTSALTPITGTSAAVRMMPVPNPPMPPTTAAATASAATAASVGASSSNLAGLHRPRTPVAVNRDIGQRRFRDLHHRGIGGTALGVHLDLHGDRSVAYLDEVRVERHKVADL